MPLKFMNKVLCGEKKLYLQTDLVKVEMLPCYKEFNIKRLWSEGVINVKDKDKKELLSYFPDYTGKKQP